MDETRVAILAIVVERADHIDQLNEILHEYRKYIIGRMGLPYESGIFRSSVSLSMRRCLLSVLCPEKLVCWTA